MKKKRRLGRKFMRCLMVSILLVVLNINPVAEICMAIANSGFVDRLGNLKDNLIYIAGGGSDTVMAAEDDITINCSCTVECDHADEINKLMGNGSISLKDIKAAIGDNATTIVGAIEANNESLDAISANVIEVNNTLNSISTQLAGIDSAIRAQQHEYRVAHLYSLNNEFPDVRWRPTSSDVPYVEDFAIVQGKFANVYSGYWNSEISTITNPGGDKVSRALEVLGYDAIVRREGIILQKTVSPIGGGNGLSGENVLFENYTEDGENKGSALTIATYEQELMTEDNVTWLDAVTLLYKALGQYQYTYQSFMSLDQSITPETSPAFQNLSNPVITVEADGTSHYNGYSFKVFLSRSNIVTSNPNASNMHDHKNVYWDKAMRDQVIPVGVTMDSSIDGGQFCRLAHRLMVAYGEPEMTMDETMALLQVYGTDFPIAMGIDTADAWAYLKVRGCLSDGVIASISKEMTLSDLLDVCMRIKDKDSRLDYKNIDVVLDIGSLLRDDGYYPVKDLKFSNGEFNTSITYDYKADTTYEYFVTITDDMGFPKDCSIAILGDANVGGRNFESLILSEEFKTGKDKSPYISGAEVLSADYSLNNANGVLLRIPKSYTGNIYLYPYKPGDKIEFVETQQCKGLCIPSKYLGGGVFSGGLFKDSNNGLWTVSDSTSWLSWDKFTGIESTLEFCDYTRAGQSDRPNPTVASSGDTIVESLWAVVDKWTSPMTAMAASNNERQLCFTVAFGDGSGTSNKGKFNYSEMDGHLIDSVKHVDSDIILSNYPTTGPEITGLWKPGDGSSVSGINIASDWKHVMLNRLYYVGRNSNLRLSITNESSGLVNGITTKYYPKVTWVAQYKVLDVTRKNPGQPTATPLQAFQAMRVGTYTKADIDGNGVVRNWNLSDSTRNDYIPLRTINTGSGSESGYYAAVGAGGSIVSAYANNAIYEMNTTNKELFARYVLAATPGLWISPDGKAGSFNSSIPLSPAEHFDNNVDDKESKAFNDMVTSMLANDMHKEIEKNIASLVRENKLSGSDYSPSDGYTFTFDSGSLTGPNRLGDMLGNIENNMGSNLSNILDIDQSVSDSAIMSRREEKLLSWTSLFNAGVVYNGVGGERPKPDNTGCYYFMTKDGQVKVNPRLCTIQIGTTLYDLMPSEGKGPILVYTDPDTNEMFIDVRCVMGNIQTGWVKNDDATATLMKNSIGSGNYVIYDIGSNGVESTIFKAYDIACYNFPAVPVSEVDSLCDSELYGYYTIKTLSRTAYDNKNDIGNTDIKYWGDDEHYNDFSRIALASFCPTANWITVIDDNRNSEGSKGEVSASLFVYYPREPFISGFDNLGNHTDGNNLDNVWISDPNSDRFDDWEEAVDEANIVNPSGGSASLKDALAAAYTDNPQFWFDKMSCESIAHLYKMTGRYYISGDFVVREFKIGVNKYDYVSAWDDYSGLVGDNDPSSTAVSDDNKYYKNAANAPGAIYWLEGIGFVYNMPSISEFTLEKYLAGVYPLPIAYNKDESYYTRPCIVNYNLNYWGKWQSVSDDGTAKENNSVPYGYTLAKDGYVHYKNINQYFANTKAEFPKLKMSGCTVLPFIDDQSKDGSMKPAAAGVYYSFGGNPYEIAKVSSLTQYNTQQNYFFWGTTRVVMTSSDNSTDKLFKYICNDFASTAIPGVAAFNRVYSSRSRDMLVYNGSVNVASTSLVGEVDINDYAVGQIDNPLDKLGATDLLRAIDEGASFAIVFSFEVFPIIGVILMMFLVGLSFVSDNKVVQKICEKTVDPVRVLTLGHRNINTWSWKKVLIPCTLLLCMFALFYNGNLIRIVQYLAEWYGTVMKFAKRL